MSEGPKPQEVKPEYNENNSVLIQDLVIAIKRTPQGPALLLNPTSIQELKLAMADIDIAVIHHCIHVTEQRAREMQQNAQDISRARNGGIVGFARNIKRRF